MEIVPLLSKAIENHLVVAELIHSPSQVADHVIIERPDHMIA